MPEQQIIEQCAPTLAGIKTGSLFSVYFESPEQARDDIRKMNQMLRKKGLRAVPVGQQKNGRTLIYLFRPEYLRKDFCDPDAAKILKDKGYPYENIDVCIALLARHLKKDSSFPHEIGLFLGYPPEDVKGFMNSPNEGVQCVGYWKVYGNKEKAEKTFRRYRKCTEIFRDQFQNGVPLSQLAVGNC